jgi:Flp pilus assembly protein TadD
MKVLKDWLAKHPDELQVASVLSGMDIARKNYAEARVYLKQVLAKAPHDPASLNNLAWIDQKLGKLDEARTLAGQAYLLAPSPQTADTLGWILVAAKEPAQAVVLLRQAHAGSTDPRIAYHYAVALNATGDKAQAVKLLHVAVASKVKYSEKPDAATLLDKLTKGS